MSNVIARFLLVSCMNTRNHLLYFARFCALSTPKKANDKPTTKNFAGFHDHLHLLALLEIRTCLKLGATQSATKSPV